jgi:tetratricopeptide (TPR) repeat protein
MRILKFALLLVAARLVTPTFCSAQTKVIESNSGTAYGKVLLALNHKFIEHAEVKLYNLSTGWSSATLTDADGKFELEGLPLGQYRLTVKAPLCERFEIQVSIEEGTGPLRLELAKLSELGTPVNNLVVSVQELKESSKAESAFERGTKFLQKGDAQSSLVYFEKAVAKDPGYYRAYHNLGLAQYLLGEKAQAEEALQRAIDLTNGGYAPSQFALAMILLDKQQYGEAEAVILQGLTMEPGSAQGEYLLGLVQFASERFAEAERSARGALLRSANQAEAYILLAEIHARRHEPYSVEADVAAYFRLDREGPLADEANLLLKQAQIEISKVPGDLRL